MKVERVIGIEPNEHQIPRFQGKYRYYTHLSENPERPHSPYVSVLLMCGILRFNESQCFSDSFLRKASIFSKVNG